MSGKGSRVSRLQVRLTGAWDRIQAALQTFWHRVDRWAEACFDDATRSKDGAVAQQFKPDAVAVEEAPVPVSANAALYVVLALLVVAILWAVFGTLNRVVVAPGTVATRTPLIVMQPFTTSRILEIAVKPGDHVRKGQLLVSFDPAFAQADEAALQQKVFVLQVLVARLTAELNGGAFAALPSDGAERQTQAQIFDQEIAERSAELAQRESQVAALNSQIRADNASITDLHKQLDMAYKEVRIFQFLLNEKAEAPLDVMKAQSNALDVKLHLETTLGDLRKLIEQRAEARSESQSYLDKWRSDHNQQLVQARHDLADASETLDKAKEMKAFTRMTAPADATVLNIADRSVGSVLREAETLMTLVPDNAHLYVEANVRSRDVSYVKVGNQVQVKLETYPFQKYGTLEGRLDVISPDSVPLKQDDQSQLVYQVQVELLKTPRELIAQGFRLRPGLVASAEIMTGKRTIASYVLNPILRTTDDSMREP